MGKKNGDYIQIDLLDMLKSVWNYKYIVVLFVVVAVILTSVITVCFTPDTYTSSGVIYVSGKSDTNDEQDSEVQKSDIDTARVLSTTYIETLKTRTFLTEVSKNAGNKYTWSQIKNMMYISTINDTELLTVEFTANSAVDAYNLTKSVLDLAPEILSKVAKGGSIEVLDKAQLPESANSKGLFSKVAISGVVGAVLAVAIIFVLTYFNNKITKSEDIENRYNFSILGIIENNGGLKNV